ncbi:MAG: GDSL-type esterase/lipase family protein [Lachnospiraceae bacterium]
MKTIVCYGDSNTWGYEPKTDTRLLWEERWTGILAKLLGEEYHMEEHGFCGRTTACDSEMEPYVNGLESAYVCAEEQSPFDIAIIMLGTNDCKDMYDVSPLVIAKGIGCIGQIFKEKGNHVILISPVCLKNMKQSPFAEEFGIGAEEKSRKLHGFIKEIAQINHYGYMDAQLYAQAGFYDGIHLDRVNHKKLAAAIYEKLLEMKGVL